MKVYTRLLGSAAVMIACAGATAIAQQPKAKVLVNDLVAQGVQPHEAAVMSTAACQEMAKKSGLDVLCGEDIRTMMKFSAMNAAFDACNDEKCYASMGRAMKARYVVSGSVSRLGSEYVLAMSMFDTEEGRAVGRGEAKAETLEKLHLQIPEIAGSLKAR